MKATFTVLAAAVAVSFAVPSVVQAQIGDPSAPLCSVSDVLTEFNVQATACSGSYPGNPSQIGFDAIIGEIAELGWGDGTFVGKIDETAEEGSAGFDDVDFDPSGSISFDSPLNGDYVLALKAAQRFSLYYFAGLVNVSSFDFTINGGNPARGLSNVSLLTTSVSVPEPEGWALMLTGLLALGFVAQRRSRQGA